MEDKEIDISNQRAEIRKEIEVHQEKVGYYLSKLIVSLKHRKKVHDKSKFTEPEWSGYCKIIPELNRLIPNSTPHKEKTKELIPLVECHYKKNRHHIEYFDDGINDMHLIDILEMICDWLAAEDQFRQMPASVYIKMNKERYGMTDQLNLLILNTMEALRKGL